MAFMGTSERGSRSGPTGARLVTMMQLEVWRVQDTGLAPAPGRFRRLRGGVRHHRGDGDEWPGELALTLDAGDLLVTGPDGEPIGVWPERDVRTTKVSDGPPVSFILEVPGSRQLLAAATGVETAMFLAALSGPA